MSFVHTRYYYPSRMIWRRTYEIIPGMLCVRDYKSYVRHNSYAQLVFRTNDLVSLTYDLVSLMNDVHVVISYDIIVPLVLLSMFYVQFIVLYVRFTIWRLYVRRTISSFVQLIPYVPLIISDVWLCCTSLACDINFTFHKLTATMRFRSEVMQQ